MSDRVAYSLAFHDVKSHTANLKLVKKALIGFEVEICLILMAYLANMLRNQIR